MTIDVSNLSVPDATTALRSYPRRYGELMRSFEGDDNVEAMARRLSPTGESAVGATVDTVRTFELLTQALKQIMLRDDPVLHTGVLDPAERVWPDAADEPIESLLGELKTAAGALADEVQRVSADEWRRTAALAGAEQTVSALDVVREAVRTGTDNLHAAEQAMAAARG